MRLCLDSVLTMVWGYLGDKSRSQVVGCLTNWRTTDPVYLGVV